MILPEDPITEAAAGFAHFRYGPFADEAGRAPAVDCVAYVALVLREASLLDFEVGDEAWLRLMVGDPTEPWSAPQEVARQVAGAAYVDPWGLVVGEAGPQRPSPGRWHVCQGWQSLSGDGPEQPMVIAGDRGHAFLWYAHNATEGCTLESQPATDGPTRWGPGAFATRTHRYRAGVAWCVLPEVA